MINDTDSTLRRDQALVAAAAIGAAALLPATPADAATARNGSYYLLLLDGGDQFHNYDFISQTSARDNVDWPVTMFFYNDAEIDRVKSILPSAFNHAGGMMYATQKDGSSLAWDSDRGRKNPVGSCPENIHMRFYADPNDDRMYNVADGYYIFATTHKDIRENCTGEEFGHSEAASDQFANIYEDQGYAVYRDSVNFLNYEPSRNEGNHIWSNDGYATKVRIP